MTPFEWIAVAIVAVLSSARLTRLATFDDFPPVKYLRDRYFDWTDKTDRRRQWQILAFCGYCASFWITSAVVAWGFLTGWHTAWWLVNGIFGGSYVAAIIMANDGDDN